MKRHEKSMLFMKNVKKSKRRNIFNTNVASLWNIFYTFVAKLKIILNMNILQTSLFPRQGEFSSERFESFLTNYNIESIVSSSINAAFDYVVSSPIEVLRVKSDVMNEQVFNKIRDGLLENGIVSENNFMMSRAGNVKNCFTIDDYIFVIAKEGAPHNNTKVTDNILNQSCDKDIIQIQYVINNGWTELAGMRFVYEYYGHAVYTHDINQYGESYFGLTNTSVESDVDEPTITIKPGIKRQVSNE